MVNLRRPILVRVHGSRDLAVLHASWPPSFVVHDVSGYTATAQGLKKFGG